ncbi:MAG: ABC transporter ATP-binding protein [Firmicutes bacterium]|nr:ABC transporter ATP-binding protein [Bacillota bacterium]
MRTNRLGFCYGDHPALHEISLHFREGGFYGILGPNGSGKTTLVNLLCGVLRPSYGSVVWGGRELNRCKRAEIARSFAVVPQDNPVNFPFTVQEIVMMGRKPHLGRLSRLREEDLEIVFDCMRQCGVLEFAEKPVTSLSGGERQRVILARALAQTPQVLFLDEATSNLDICYKLELLNLINQMKRERGLTVIAVMHDLNLAGIFCDYFMYLNDGRVFCEGPAERVFNEEVIREVFKVRVEIKQDSATRRFCLNLLPDPR